MSQEQCVARVGTPVALGHPVRRELPVQQDLHYSVFHWCASLRMAAEVHRVAAMGRDNLPTGLGGGAVVHELREGVSGELLLFPRLGQGAGGEKKEERDMPHVFLIGRLRESERQLGHGATFPPCLSRPFPPSKSAFPCRGGK